MDKIGKDGIENSTLTGHIEGKRIKIINEAEPGQKLIVKGQMLLIETNKRNLWSSMIKVRPINISDNDESKLMFFSAESLQREY